jgi:transposase
MQKIIDKRNEYIKNHKRAKIASTLNYCNDKLRRLKIEGWVKLRRLELGREIELVLDEVKLSELSRLDGCYCLTTSLSVDDLDKELVHKHYKDLAMVEHAFRTCKTGQLEMRPIYVRNKKRTRGQVLVVMLSYLNCSHLNLRLPSPA